MSSYQMKIELLSDLCVSDGGVYNSSLDVDICHDSFGFPYIPAKRLKGCLRECALELQDWGMDISPEDLFGEGGKASNRGKIRISDAKLEHYDQMKRVILKNQNAIVFHPQNVLNHFSYVRTQTSIDYETGVAEENSLRTIRVANKGLCFYADVESDDNYKTKLENCCPILTHIGMARTRGLGEVRATIVPGMKETTNENYKVEYHKGDQCLEYSFQLLEPVICKSTAGGESRTQDYIEGSKIFGIFAGELRKRGKDVLKFLNTGQEERFICSNAYLEADGQRLTEVPATYYSIKNNKTTYIDKAYHTEKNEQKTEDFQLNPMKHCYVCKNNEGKLKKYDVKIEERYHHRRPADKSIGRVSESGDGLSKFYQMSSIQAGQTFHGYVYGSKEQIQILAECLGNREHYIGYSRSSEYGKIEFQKVYTCQRPKAVAMTGSILKVKLESPAIIYSDKAMYSTKIEDLKEEIIAALGLTEQAETVESYINYTTIGGFNVTWGHRKPTIEGFDKGTVVLIKLKETVTIALPQIHYIGERTQEGFGEISVEMLDLTKNHYEGTVASVTDCNSKQPIHVSGSDFAKALCDDLLKDYIRNIAVEHTKVCIKQYNTGYLKPTVSNLISMVKDPSNPLLKEIEKNVQDRFDKKSSGKQKKLNVATQVINDVREKTKTLIEDFNKEFGIEDYQFDHDQLVIQYMTVFLTEIKYLLRKQEGGKENSEDEK
jgi:CRISPR/Cas system CSM-associated protein Csm3 (group 7 of RAMP superfamily)